MFFKSLLALTLVGAVVWFRIGWAAPSPSLSPAQPPERETEVAAVPHCPGDREQAHTQAGRCREVPRPVCKVEEPARPDGCVTSSPNVAACPTPPTPANLRCEPPEPRCEPRAPLPCHEPTRTHTMTIENGAHVERQTFVWRHGSWQSCGEFHTSSWE
jgi:hypothetical protein